MQVKIRDQKNYWSILKEKKQKLDSLVPQGFKNLGDFLGYCQEYSQTQRALFSFEQVNSLLKMAGRYPIEKTLFPDFIPAYWEEMNPLLEKIEKRKKYCSS